MFDHEDKERKLKLDIRPIADRERVGDGAVILLLFMNTMCLSMDESNASDQIMAMARKKHSKT